MDFPFVCYCKRVSVPTVIEGRTVLVCRHLQRSSRYRAKHPPCAFQHDETDEALELRRRARVRELCRRPEPFRPLPPPPDWDPLAVYMPKCQVVRTSSSGVGERSRLAENAPVDVNMPFLLEDEEEMEADEVARLCALLAQERQRCSQLQRDLGASREGNDRLKRRVRNLEDRLEKVSEVLEREVEERQGTALKLEREVEAHQATKLRLQATKDDLHRLRRSVGNLRLVASSSRVSSERP